MHNFIFISVDITGNDAVTISSGEKIGTKITKLKTDPKDASIEIISNSPEFELKKKRKGTYINKT